MVGVTLLLILYGILMIRSATLGAIDPTLAASDTHQIEYAVVGLVVLFLTAAIDSRLLGALNQYIYVFLVAVLALIPVLGVFGAAGAKRWLQLGIAIQPSELAKVLLVIVLVKHLQKQYPKLDKLQTVIISLGYMGIPVVLIFLQPNLSITILLIVTWFVMIYAAGLRLKHVLIFVAVVAMGLPVLWANMQDYQKGRIFSLLNCEGNKDACYNITQARISIGSGGLLGKGYAYGTQSQLRFLRVRWTDFIFAVIAEELGFVVAVMVLALIGLLLWRIMRAASLAQDPLGSLICYGVAANIFFPTFVSIGMNLSLLPVTGLPLPFISLGGSSLVTLLFGIGLVESVVVRHKGLDY